MKPQFNTPLSFMALGTILILASGAAYADQTTDAPISGSVEATRGAVQTLEDALEQSSANVTGVKADDYKKWNLSFRQKLDAAMLTYESSVETQVADVLQPQVNQYNQVLASTGFSQEQLAALTSSQLQELNDKATSLANAYSNIYVAMMAQVFPWMPTVRFDQSSYTCKNTNGLFESTNHVAFLNYDILSLAGGASIGSGKASYGYQESPCPSQTGGIQAVESEGDPSQYIKDANIDTTLVSQLLVPYIKSVCSSQVCLPLVEADLQTALGSITQNIHQPFTVTLSDGNNVQVNAANFSVAEYMLGDSLLTQPITDSSLPFDN
jgi:hypothetical protein